MVIKSLDNMPILQPADVLQRRLRKHEIAKVTVM